MVKTQIVQAGTKKSLLECEGKKERRKKSLHMKSLFLQQAGWVYMCAFECMMHGFLYYIHISLASEDKKKRLPHFFLARALKLLVSSSILFLYLKRKTSFFLQ